jgi:hypothetical protein
MRTFQLVVDEQQLALATSVHDSVITTLPAPAAGMLVTCHGFYDAHRPSFLVTATPIVNIAQRIAVPLVAEP